MLKKPQNVYLPIDKFQAKVFKHRDDAKKGEWVANFALALAEEADDPFAKSLLEKAQVDLYKDMVRSWRFNAKKALVAAGVKEPNETQIHKKCAEDYGEEYADALELLARSSKRIRKNLEKITEETTADGDTREDSLNNATSGNGSATESGTSATHSATTPASVSAGRTGGGSVRGTKCSIVPPVRSSGPMPANVQKVYDFASAEGLDHDDAYECWYVTTVERNGNDADGNPVTNWKPFLKTWCNTRKTKRSA